MIGSICITFASVLIVRRERVRSLLHLSNPFFRFHFKKHKNKELNTEPIMDSQEKRIETKAAELLAEEPGYFVVEAGIRPTNNIKLVVDADQGATIDRLSKLNRALYKWLEETTFPDGNFSLEVSSPGLDEPLKLHRQYVKNIGRPVTIVLSSGVTREGKLVQVSESAIVIEEEKGKGKKKETVQHRVLKNEIKSTKIQIRI